MSSTAAYRRTARTQAPLRLTNSQVEIFSRTFAETVLGKTLNGDAQSAVIGTNLPEIGTAWQGGLYAGLSIHENRPVALVVLPGDEKLTWDAARSWAEKQGGTLPSRIDQLVLFQNLKAQFKEATYWSSAPCAGSASYAWCQYFDYGGQSYYHEDYELRARAVRRLSIQ
jgi:hypothetical protein